MGMNGAGALLSEEIKKRPVSLALLIIVLSAFWVYAETKHASASEVEEITNRVEEVDSKVTDVQVLLLEDRVAELDRQIAALEQLIEEEKATSRDRDRLTQLKSKRARALRNLRDLRASALKEDTQ